MVTPFIYLLVLLGICNAIPFTKAIEFRAQNKRRMS
jgi:hypothetical protein